MEPRVYRYRYAATATIPFFLGLWTLGLIVGLLRQALHLPPRTNNPPEAVAILCAAGVVVGLLATRLLMGWFYERVEISEGTIRWTDWRNQEKVRARLEEIGSIRVRTPNPFVRQGFAFWRPQGRALAQGVERIEIRTGAGSIPVSETIRGYEDLKERAWSAWEENARRRGVPS